MFKVVKMFDDLQDIQNTKSGTIVHRYEVGDIYPRKGYKPSSERVAELAGSDNLQGVPLIVEIKKTVKKSTEKKTE